MKTIFYKYETITLGCGCCSDSANQIYVIDETGREIYWVDNAPTLFSKEDFIEYMSTWMPGEEFIVSDESEFC